MSTVFTRILNEELPAVKIYQDERIFAFMDAGQVNPGHVLVAPCHPYETITDMDEETAVAMMRVVHRVARAVELAFKPQGMTLLQANRPAGWQTVPHAHMHVLPRYENDGVELGWPRKDPDLDTLREYASRIVLV